MEKLRKTTNCIAVMLALFFYAFALFAVHGMHTAEGVGLYFALRLGRERMPFDLLTDLAAAFGLALLTVIPCICYEHRHMKSLLRCLLLLLSFLPVLSLAYLIHPFEQGAELTLEPFGALFQLQLPFLGMLFLALSVSAAGGHLWKRSYSILCFFDVCVLILCLLVPSLQQLLLFLMVYLLAVIIHDVWERLLEAVPAMRVWEVILLAGLGLRAIYRLLSLLSLY